MNTEKAPNGPWQALDKLLQQQSASKTFHHHPSKRVLLSYLKQSLPRRPHSWSKERAEKLDNGRLSDWTMWEVATHINNCARCRSRIRAMENAQGRQTAMSWLKTLRGSFQKPRLARLGWALAGLQAALLIGVLVWMNTVPSTRPITTVPIYVDTNSSFSNSVVLPANLIRVRLIGTARVEEITALMKTLQLRLVGPDSEGEYLLKKSDGSYLTQADTEIIKQLRTHLQLLRINDKAALPGDQGG